MATAAVLLLGLVLAGCSAGTADPAPAEHSTLVETATAYGAAGGTVDGPTAGAPAPDDPSEDAEVPEGSGSIPDGWPAAVQVVSGPIVEGVEVGEAHYVVTIATAEGGRAVFEAGADLLEKTGHAEVFRLDEDDDSLAGSWSGDGYTVAFNVSTTGGVWYAGYVVTQSDRGPAPPTS